MDKNSARNKVRFTIKILLEHADSHLAFKVEFSRTLELVLGSAVMFTTAANLADTPLFVNHFDTCEVLVRKVKVN